MGRVTRLCSKPRCKARMVFKGICAVHGAGVGGCAGTGRGGGRHHCCPLLLPERPRPQRLQQILQQIVKWNGGNNKKSQATHLHVRLQLLVKVAAAVAVPEEGDVACRGRGGWQSSMWAGGEAWAGCRNSRRRRAAQQNGCGLPRRVACGGFPALPAITKVHAAGSAAQTSPARSRGCAAHQTSGSRSTQRCAARSWPGTRLGEGQRQGWAREPDSAREQIKCIRGKQELAWGTRNRNRVERGSRSAQAPPPQAGAATPCRHRHSRTLVSSGAQAQGRTRGAGDGGGRHQVARGQLQVSVVLRGGGGEGATNSSWM